MLGSAVVEGEYRAGRDARGREQDRHHVRWRTVRDEAKDHRLACPCPCKQKAVAAIVSLMEQAQPLVDPRVRRHA